MRKVFHGTVFQVLHHLLGRLLSRQLLAAMQTAAESRGNEGSGYLSGQ